jgi:hypothetical protein
MGARLSVAGDVEPATGGDVWDDTAIQVGRRNQRTVDPITGGPIVRRQGGHYRPVTFNRKDMRRLKQVTAGMLMGLLTSWMIVGSYILAFSFGIELVGRACRLSGTVVNDLASSFTLIGLGVSGLLVLAFMVESWKHEGVPEIGEWGSHMLILALWFVAANASVLLLFIFWTGCGIWK